MMKRLLSLLLATMLLLCSFALADQDPYDLIENALYRIVLRTEEKDIPLGSGVLFIEKQVLLSSAGCVQDGALYAIGTDGEYPIAVADVLDDSGIALLEMATASENTPLHMASEESTGMACIFGVDSKGEFIVAPLDQLRSTLYHGQEAILLSSAEGLLPGGFIADATGNLIALTIAQHTEGLGTYLALDANAFYRAISRQQYAGAFLPVEAAYEAGTLTLTWTDEERTNGMYLITLSADDNAYYTFFEAPYTKRSIDIILAPGHRYDYQVQWVEDMSQALEPVWGAMSSMLLPQASFNSYDYTQTCSLVTRTDVHAAIVDLTDTTLAKMTDPGLLHYLQVKSSYNVEESIELPMSIELTAPDGQFYIETAICTLNPKKEQNDTFLLPLDALLADCAEFSGGQLLLGQYQLRYAIAGGVAGEYSFELTATSGEEPSTETETSTPISGYVTPLNAEHNNGAINLTWNDDEIPDGATVDVFYIYEGNVYYFYQRLEKGEKAAEIYSIPGRDTVVWVTWTLDPTIAVAAPHLQSDYLVIPAAPETPFTLHEFENHRLSLASSTDASAADKGEYFPEAALTREVLSNQDAFIYFQTEDTYQVTEATNDHPMLIVLCTPEGLCFIDPLLYMFDPALQTSDLWLKDITALFRDYEKLVQDAWPAGDYRILYCINGQVAGEIPFTLE